MMNGDINACAVRFTKSGSVLPLYKISVLVKSGGADVRGI